MTSSGTDVNSIIRDLGIWPTQRMALKDRDQKEPSILLLDVIDEFVKQKVESKKWSDTTVDTNRNRIEVPCSNSCKAILYLFSFCGWLEAAETELISKASVKNHLCWLIEHIKDGIWYS